MKNLLIIVDPQYDFIEGSLAVNGAKAAMNRLSTYLKSEDINQNNTDIVITVDWHPVKHCSFKDYGGDWPIHCVHYTKGAAVHPDILSAAEDFHSLAIETKGSHIDRDEYSFLSSVDRQVLPLYLDSRFGEYQNIYLCGIAGDVCVLNTLKDLQPLWSKIIVMEQFTASLDGGKALREFCENNNITLVC